MTLPAFVNQPHKHAFRLLGLSGSGKTYIVTCRSCYSTRAYRATAVRAMLTKGYRLKRSYLTSHWAVHPANIREPI